MIVENLLCDDISNGCAWDKVSVGEGLSADSTRVQVILLIHIDASQ
jgi:hypothetical protein